MVYLSSLLTLPPATAALLFDYLLDELQNSPDSGIDLGKSSMGVGTPEEGDIRMRLDPYDKLERENIRAGVFEVDSSRVGTTGADFLRKVSRHWLLSTDVSPANKPYGVVNQ